jgi:hypothetical protein
MKNITKKIEKLSLRIDLAKAALKGQTIELQNDGTYAIIVNRKSSIA